MPRLLTFDRILDADGNPVSGAQVTVSENNTSNAIQTFTEPTLTTPNASPVVANAEGIVPPIYVLAGVYRVRVQSAEGLDVGGSPYDDVLVGSEGEERTYETRTLLANASVPASVNSVRTGGYSAAGDGGDGLYRRVASEPSHAAKVQSFDGAWWELVPSRGIITPMQFGAAGDGTTDDGTAIQSCFDAAPILGAEARILRDYGTLSKLTLPDYAQVSGIRVADVSLTSRARIKKLPGWTAGTLMEIGGAADGQGKFSTSLVDMVFDGNGQSGDGLVYQRGAGHHFDNLSTVNNPNGWGLWIDGVFSFDGQNIWSYNNGNTATATGGGVRLGNTPTGRENSDCRLVQGLINANGNANLQMDAAIDFNVRQVDWKIADIEFGDKGPDYEPGQGMNYIADIRSADRCVFDTCKFVQGLNAENDAMAVMRLGQHGGATPMRNAAFRNCMWQVVDTVQTPEAIIAEGEFDNVTFLNCTYVGGPNFIDTTAGAADAEGIIRLRSCDIPPDRLSDGAGVVMVENFDRFTGYVETGPTIPGEEWRWGPRPTGLANRRTAAMNPDARTLNFGPYAFGQTPRTVAQLEEMTLFDGALVNWNGVGTFNTYTGFDSGAGYYRMGSATVAAAYIG